MIYPLWEIEVESNLWKNDQSDLFSLLNSEVIKYVAHLFVMQ
jgi:hypothetical protein